MGKGKRRGKLIAAVTIIALAGVSSFFVWQRLLSYPAGLKPGDVTDSLNGVYVHYNGRVGQTHGRNTSSDGYNIGLKYQCVEFVKRYYYEYYGHKMPDSYGHAKDFFDPAISDGKPNPQRGLTQYRNGSITKPQQGDLLIYAPTTYNKYGHVAIVASAGEDMITIIQQNPGPRGRTRNEMVLEYRDGRWHILNDRILGWLRKERAGS